MQEEELETFRPIMDELYGKTCATQHETAHRWTDYTGRASQAHECTQQQTAELQQQTGPLEQEIGNSKSFLAPLRRLPPELLAEILVIVIECCEQIPFAVMHIFLVSGIESDRAHSAWRSPNAGRDTAGFQCLLRRHSRAGLNRNTGFRSNVLSLWPFLLHNDD